MNEITTIQSNQLLAKIRRDLSAGYKVLGNYNNQVDIIRVWCSMINSEKVFAIIASSGNRFENASSFLELQSFGPGNNYRVGFLVIADQLHETTIAQTAKVDEYSIENFISDFMNAIPNHDLTEQRLTKEGYNPKNIEWIKS